MNDLDAPTRGPAVSHRCSGCSRRYVDFGESAAGEILCSCGAPLALAPLPRGLYELGAAVAEESRVGEQRDATLKKPRNFFE